MSLEYLDFEHDYYPFWEFLGLEGTCTVQDAIEKIKTLTREQKKEPKIRFAWKMLKDPFFHPLYKQCHSIKTLYRSGFFLDQYEEEPAELWNSSFFTTPLDKVREQKNLKKSTSEPYFVLLTTGGFSPLHQRHVEIMEIAKKALEKEGKIVLGGYFSPSHDQYVSQKYNGEAAMSIDQRLFLLEQAIEDHPWLSVDRWEALYNLYSINFTDVIVRLETYLNHHLPTPEGIQVCYVFGSDNAEFARAFFSKGNAVCVERKGYEHSFQDVRKEYENTNRILFIPGTEEREISSSLIRSGEYQWIEPKIRSLYLKLKNPTKLDSQNIYAIRNDAEESCPPSLSDNIDIIWGDWIVHFSGLIKEMFEQDITIKILSVKNQIQLARKKIHQNPYQTLSLDIYVPGDASFSVSRRFECAGGQFHPKELIARPGALTLEKQIEDILPGKYLLIEDDVASGNTLRYLFEMLPEGVFLEERLILSQLEKEKIKNDFYDIVDFRDFLFGFQHSGLVVTLPNEERVRVPYVLPYTSPISRSKIPFQKSLEFSLKVWKMNSDFYKQFPFEVPIKILDSNFLKLAKYLGFSPEEDVRNFIDWHIKKLKKVAN